MSHTGLTCPASTVRALTLGPAGHALHGHPASWYVTGSLLWSAGIVVVTAPLAVARYRRG